MDRKLCSGGNNKPKNWLGGEIKLKHENKNVDVLPYGFLDFEYCTVAKKDDEFELKATNDDGVCITSLSVNGKQLFVGRNNDQESFWLNKDSLKRKCLDDHMQTDTIHIQDGRIVESECKSPVTYYDIDVQASCSTRFTGSLYLSGEFKAVGNFGGRRIYEKGVVDKGNKKWWSIRFETATNRWIFDYSNNQIIPGEVVFGETITALDAEGYHPGK